jgi:copper chaperone CopZ
VDSIAVTFALLGPVFAVFRPVAAFVTGIIGGALVQLSDQADEEKSPEQTRSAPCDSECCAEAAPGGALLRALHHGFVTIPRDIGLAMLVGILIAGAIGALVPQDSLAAYIGGGVLSILLLMAVGLPVYVCATASVPIAAGFIHIGASPGAALAFLIAGPATNAAAFTTIWTIMGRRAAMLYLVVAGASALGCGLLLNWLMPVLSAGVPQLGSHTHGGAETGWSLHAWAIVLLAVFAFAYKPTFRRKTEEPASTGGTGSADYSAGRQALELVVSGMTCAHCADSVRRALSSCRGVQSVEVDLRRGRAVVTGEQLDEPQLALAVAELGFEVKNATEIH